MELYLAVEIEVYIYILFNLLLYKMQGIHQLYIIRTKNSKISDITAKFLNLFFLYNKSFSFKVIHFRHFLCQKHSMPFRFVYRPADIRFIKPYRNYNPCLQSLRYLSYLSAEISAVRYTNLNGIVYIYTCTKKHNILMSTNFIYFKFKF